MNFPKSDAIDALIRLAREEDLGPRNDDVTSRLLIDENSVGSATLVQKSPGVVCGLPIVQRVCATYDRKLHATVLADCEGSYHATGVGPVAMIDGPLRSILSAERVVLNFVQRMSGVATLTRKYVDLVQGTRARIFDTRKTMPGFRALDKYAVVAGGGANHRIGLYDMVLVKDNHLAARPASEWAPFLRDVVARSRAEDALRPIEVEVDSLEQFAEVLKVDAVDIVLLDNFDCQSMARAVEMRKAAGRETILQLEASGGVNLTTVAEIARTGVDRISVGALTHSAPAMDIGLDVTTM